MKKRFECVLFDFDDTLYPFENCELATLEIVYEKLKSELSNDLLGNFEYFLTLYCEAREKVNNDLRVKPKTHIGAEDVSYTQAGSHSRTVIFKRLLTYLLGMKEYSRILRLSFDLGKLYESSFILQMDASFNQEVTKLLSDLRGAGCKLGLVTNYTLNSQLHKLLALKIENCFDLVLTSEETGGDKPDSLIFKRALDKLEVSADKTVMIGDSHTDIYGAISVGISAIKFRQSTKRIVCDGESSKDRKRWKSIADKFECTEDIDDLRKLLFLPVDGNTV